MRKLIALLVVVSSSAFAEYPSVEKQLKLYEAMHIDQVKALLGVPDEVESKTCGDKTPKPWPCRVWRFHQKDSGSFFRVTFGFYKGDWYLNNWAAF